MNEERKVFEKIIKHRRKREGRKMYLHNLEIFRNNKMNQEKSQIIKATASTSNERMPNFWQRLKFAWIIAKAKLRNVFKKKSI